MPAVEGQERLDALPPGAALRDYTIEDVLGHGGFGIVYRARHNELGNVVAVKEYLPVELAVRDGAAVRVRGTESLEAYEDGLLRFRDEARALIEFQSHPSIVSCREFFRANGTAYLVMEHEDGLPLSELLRRREASGRPFDEADLLQVMIPLLEGLARVHEAGMLHRDIKPSNILIRRSDERPVLIDFGAAKQGFAERSKSLAPHTEGYAAPEQVGAGKLGPWTDVYAAGAVMWRTAAGGNPPKVENRAFAALRGEADPMPSARELGAGRFSPGVFNAIDRCLKLNEKERIRGCGELLRLLRGAGAEAAAEKVGRGPVRKRPEEPAAAAATAAPQADLSKVVARITVLLLTYVSTAAAQAGRRKRLWGILAAAGVILAAVYALAVWTGAGRASSGTETVSTKSARRASGWITWGRASRETEAVSTAPQDTGGSLEDAALARAEAQWEAVRGRRDAAAARAYIEEYGGLEGAGVWVRLAESLVEELDSQAKERADAAARRRKAKEAAEKELKRPGRRFRDCDACPEMVVLPAGSFLMGSPESEEGRFGWEGPQHRIEIREAFAAGVYEATFEEWGACAADGGCGGYRPEDYGWGRGRRPVIAVSWEDAQAYINWLSRKTGEEYRLLSEAEWEYAARAGTTARYTFGNGITPSDANYGENIGKTQRVGSYRANGYGLYDMHGNAWEWVQDCFNEGYARAPNNGSAWERGDCSLRVWRGGSWHDYPRLLRSANRFAFPPGNRNFNIGFRVARTLTP